MIEKFHEDIIQENKKPHPFGGDNSNGFSEWISNPYSLIPVYWVGMMKEGKVTYLFRITRWKHSK